MRISSHQIFTLVSLIIIIRNKMSTITSSKTGKVSFFPHTQFIFHTCTYQRIDIEMRLKGITNSHAKWKKNCIETLTAFHLLAKLHDKSLLVYLSNAWDLQQLIAYTAAAAAFVTTVKLIFFLLLFKFQFLFLSFMCLFCNKRHKVK